MTSLSFVAFASGTGLFAFIVSAAGAVDLKSVTDSAATSGVDCLSTCGDASDFELVTGFLSLSFSLKSPFDDVAVDISFLLPFGTAEASEPNVGQSDESANLLYCPGETTKRIQT